MKRYIYTCYDTAVEAHLDPFYMRADGEAIRGVLATLDRPDHPFTKHPDQYILFRHGSFDDDDASFELHPPKSLGTVLELSFAAKRDRADAEDQLN